MIIVVSPDASPEDLDHIVARVEETGRQAHLSVGTERSIIGVIGPDDPSLQDTFEALPHVESVHRVTKPYKLVSRDFHPANTIVDVGLGVTVGGTELAVMAGPCSIENESHIFDAARAVKAAGDKAVRWCRDGNGPYILEMMTYRYRGHSMSDPAKYRTREEVEKVRGEQDPIEQVRSRLLQKKMASEDDLKKIDAKVRDVVNEASEFATHDIEPDPSELYTDILR